MEQKEYDGVFKEVDDRNDRLVSEIEAYAYFKSLGIFEEKENVPMSPNFNKKFDIKDEKASRQARLLSKKM